MTPPPLLGLFKLLLKNLSWKLADATPRKILLDSGFLNGLRQYLGLDATRNPSLSDLHPSLGNLDHVRRHILLMRQKFYPNGTDFDGE